MSRRVIAVVAGLAALLAPATVAHGVWQSTASATLAVTTAPGVVSPPMDVGCTDGTGFVRITWAAGTTIVSRYEVVHGADVLATAAPGATRTDVTTASNGKRTVLVRAVFAPGVHADSGTVEITTTPKDGVRCG